MAYWACHLLGAVPVLVNAFVPGHVIAHCLTNTTCKLIVLDAERASRLASHMSKVKTEAGATGVLVVIKKQYDREFLKSALKVGADWDVVMANPKHTKVATSQSWKKEPDCSWGDDSAIFFTSGTTGLPKGVLLSQLASITSSFYMICGGVRHILRNGETFDWAAPPPSQRTYLLVVPLFHVTGCQITLLSHTLISGRIVMMRKWDVQKALGLIKKESITAVGG